MDHCSSTISHNFHNSDDEQQLEVSNPQDILKLCGSLIDNNNTSLQIKINKYLKQCTGSKNVFLASVCSAENIIVHVIDECALKKEILLPIIGSFCNIAFQKRIPNIVTVDKFNTEIIEFLNEIFLTEKCLVIPIKHRQTSNIVLFACLIGYSNKIDEYLHAKLVKETFRYCLSIILNTIAYEEEARLKKQCQELLTVARKLFSHLGDLTDLLKEIMSEAKNLTKAERCSLFLKNPDDNVLVAKVFDGVASNDTVEVKLSTEQGIAGHVAKTGKVLNITDAYKHPLFYRGIDDVTGFKTRNILCFPIKNENHIVGVAQLCNKMGGAAFDKFDEDVAVAFSIYCGISIMHSLVYKKIQDAQARNKLSNELMIYHMKVHHQDVKKLTTCKKSHTHKDFETLSFSPRILPVIETPCFVIQMYEKLNLIETFKIKRESLARFILYVKKGYRDTPYHNWMHAFSVMHFAYLCLVNFEIVTKGLMTDLEALALLTSCLCHDLDHRGTNNSFQTQSGSVLASLYSSDGSVMERHHLSQTMCILNTEGCNFLEQLSHNDYTKCLDYIRDNILATDLSQHFRLVNQFEKMIQNGYNNSNDQHKQLLSSLIMTCSDLSDQTKEWPVIRKIAEFIYTEFFTQGDLEKSMGNKPIEMMDRERAMIPHLQVQFLSTVVIPVFEILHALFPKANCLVEQTKKNSSKWESMKPIFEECMKTGTTSMDVLTSNLLDKDAIF